MGVPKATEMTVRSLLIRELQRRGVRVSPEVSLTTPVGRMQPDAILQNSGDYVVETKLGAEAKLLDAMVKLYDYAKYTESKGAFAILFPEQLRRPWPAEMLEHIASDPKLSYKATGLFKDLRPTQQFAGNLSDIADWIARHVLKPPIVEADTSLAIRVLSDAVDFITTGTKKLRGEELEDIFGGKTVFENILQYKEEKYPLEEMRKAATYLLINQILFYRVLSSVDAQYPAIDEAEIQSPKDLMNKYFQRVLTKDYTATFGFDVASRLPDDSTQMVKKVLKVIEALAPQKIRHDILGQVFHELIPFEVRKEVAAFYTNNEAAELLAQLAINDYDAKVMDLAVGSGTLLVAAYRRKRELFHQTKGFVELEKLHRRFIEQDLTGIDIMPFAAHLAVVHLSLQALLAGQETEKVRIAVWDSTELRPGQTIPAISRELRAAYRRPTLDTFIEGKPFSEKAYANKGVITLEGMGGEKIPLTKTDLVIMNPPFTRRERIPESYREELGQRFQDYSEYIWGKLGLHSYFIFLADTFLKLGGRMALVLPASVLRTLTTEPVRDFLTQKYYIEFLITTTERAAFSEGAQFREILLVARKIRDLHEEEKVDPQLPCHIVILTERPKEPTEARTLADRIKLTSRRLNIGESESFDGAKVWTVSQGDLYRSRDNLFRFIAVLDPRLKTIWDRVCDTGQTVLGKFNETIGNVKDKVILGIEIKKSPIPVPSSFVIRDPERIIKSTDRWLLKRETSKKIVVENRFTKEVIEIPKSSLRLGMRRASRLDTVDVEDSLDYIVCKDFRDAPRFFEKYDKARKELSTFREYLQGRSTNLAIMRRFDISAPGTTHLAYFSKEKFTPTRLMWCVQGLDDENVKILALWFNSTLNLLQMVLERIETRGAFFDFAKYMLGDFSVIDVSALNERQRKALISAFERKRRVKMPSLLNQLAEGNEVRRDIDETILNVLGFNRDEAAALLSYLYPALHKEIKTLKELMAG